MSVVSSSLIGLGVVALVATTGATQPSPLGVPATVLHPPRPAVVTLGSPRAWTRFGPGSDLTRFDSGSDLTRFDSGSTPGFGPNPDPGAPLRSGVSGGDPTLVMDARSLARRLRLAELASPRRGRNIVLGAVLGGVAGLATCTVISNLTNDPGTGFSTCTAKGYALLGGGGAALGALVGALVD